MAIVFEVPHATASAVLSSGSISQNRPDSLRREIARLIGREPQEVHTRSGLIDVALDSAANRSGDSVSLGGSVFSFSATSTERGMSLKVCARAEMTKGKIEVTQATVAESEALLAPIYIDGRPGTLAVWYHRFEEMEFDVHGSELQASFWEALALDSSAPALALTSASVPIGCAP